MLIANKLDAIKNITKDTVTAGLLATISSEFLYISNNFINKGCPSDLQFK